VNAPPEGASARPAVGGGSELRRREQIDTTIKGRPRSNQSLETDSVSTSRRPVSRIKGRAKSGKVSQRKCDIRHYESVLSRELERKKFSHIVRGVERAPGEGPWGGRPRRR